MIWLDPGLGPDRGARPDRAALSDPPGVDCAAWSRQSARDHSAIVCMAARPAPCQGQRRSAGGGEQSCAWRGRVQRSRAWRGRVQPSRAWRGRVCGTLGRMGPVVESVARIAVAVAALSLAAIGLAELAREALRSRPKPVRRDTGPLAAVNFAGIGGFVLAGMGTALSMVGTVPLAGPAGMAARLLGLLVLATAGWLAAWGLRSIGRQLASPPEVRPDTVLVTHGAFGLVRHPLYLSILLLWAGGALALGSWLMAAGEVLLVPAFVARCRLEERLLVGHFGEAYLSYAARVPMLLPRPRGVRGRQAR